MNLIPWIALLVICFIVIKSILLFLKGGRVRVRLERSDSRFSADLFYILLIIYSIVIVGFGLIYFILSIEGIVLVEDGELRQVSALGSMIHSLYFSGVTLLTIGYGDITPIGIGRLIALIQALIGYVLPTAFVLKVVQSSQRVRDK